MSDWLKSLYTFKLDNHKIMNAIYKFKNRHLAVSSITVTGVGLAYGISPNQILPFFFDFKVESIDLNNIFRALMGLYLGLASYWIFGIYKSEYWKHAALVSIIFMGGLAFGRIVSILQDGMPSIPFLIGTVLELAFMMWGIKNLNSNIV